MEKERAIRLYSKESGRYGQLVGTEIIRLESTKPIPSEILKSVSSTALVLRNGWQKLINGLFPLSV